MAVDAEEKQLGNSVVKNWLDEFKKAVCDAKDFIYTIKTEASQQEMEGKLGSITGQAFKLLSVFSSRFEKDMKCKVLIDWSIL